MDEKLNKIIDERIGKYLQNSGFLARKLSDTPNDNLQVVPRKYVNMYGSILSRPASSVVGQQYFDTTNGYPIFRNQNYQWVNSVGSVIG